MNSTIPEPLLQPLREYLQSSLCLNFHERIEKDMIRKITSAATEFGYSEVSGFVEWLLTATLSNEQLGILSSHLTIGETYFMRDKKSFEFLEQIYLPGLISRRYTNNRRIRIWCAGCASGEEAYSLAIVLLQSIPNIKSWDITIQATDINPLFLEKARRGIFTKWSFRTNSPEFIERYFKKKGDNEFHILPHIKSMVSFSSLNLAGNDYPSESGKTKDVDIIFCRNVLIYFSPKVTK